MFKKNTNYFYAVRISISVAILSEIFIQIGYFSKSYARKQKWMFFSEHSVQCLICDDCLEDKSEDYENCTVVHSLLLLKYACHEL